MNAACTPALDHAAAGVLRLPTELTIYAVGELHPAWLAWAEAGGCEVDGAAVDQIDAAGLQMLLALGRSLQARGQPMRLTATSRVLDEGCAALGLAGWLADHREGAPA